MELKILPDSEIVTQIETVLQNKLPLESLLKPLCLSVAKAQAKVTRRQDIEWLEAHNQAMRMIPYGQVVGTPGHMLVVKDWRELKKIE